MLCAACDAEHDGDVCPHASKRRANDPYQDPLKASYPVIRDVSVQLTGTVTEIGANGEGAYVRIETTVEEARKATDLLWSRATITLTWEPR